MANMSDRSDVGVLGAGIMGCCLALELAHRGYGVDLIERASAPMTGASLHNEGKLHLGFVYANDPLKETHGLMARGSMCFSRIIERLTGVRAAGLAPSRPFHYFVPVDSQLRLSAIHDHFHEVEAAIREVHRSTGDRYLDLEIDRYFERNSSDDHESLFSPDLTLGSFRTCERSVSPTAVADALTRAVRNHPAIRFIGNTDVLAAHRLARSEVEIKASTDGQTSSSRYSCVANCLWEDKLRVDRTAGIVDAGTWLLRYKATITLAMPAPVPLRIPSATGILGSYGDVVNHDDRSYYVSWYPICKVAQVADGDARKLHDEVRKQAVAGSSAARRKFIRDSIGEMAVYVPSIENLLSYSQYCAIGGGVIVARGATDIDDPNSYLHQRSTIGPVAHGSCITLDTGKYCTAPLFAGEAADMVSSILC
jgi:glycine/D-amino acid oxidase-like deaminating enzyme